jgi:hypothetical protein
MYLIKNLFIFLLYTNLPLPYTSYTEKEKTMAKKRKEYKRNSSCGEKAEQIIREIETAQSQKRPAEEILKNTSEHLKQEPCLTIHVIEALAKIPSTETAQLLMEMMAEAEEKQIIKAIKRTLYKLKQKGVTWEENSPKEEPVLKPPKPAEPLGYLGSIDATGSRIIIIGKPQPQRGLLLVFSIVNDLEGIQEFSLKAFSKKGFNEFIKDSLSSSEFPIVTAPGAYCIHLLREAATLTKRLSKPLPQGYHDAERELSTITRDYTEPLIYQYIQEDAVKDSPQLLKDSINLHKIMPFSTWHIPASKVQQYATQITETQQSKLVLRPDQKEARLNTIYRDALEELFPEEKRLLWKQRLEEVAYILLKTGKEQEAQTSLCAAIDLNNPFRAIDPNPFIWNLLLKSIYILIEEDYEKQEEEKKSSLIVPP